MTGDFQLAARAEMFKRELYRNRRPLEFGVDVCMSDAPTWRDALLTKFGNLLITVGTRLKNTSHPRAALSQEML